MQDCKSIGSPPTEEYLTSFDIDQNVVFITSRKAVFSCYISKIDGLLKGCEEISIPYVQNPQDIIMDIDYQSIYVLDGLGKNLITCELTWTDNTLKATSCAKTFPQNSKLVAIPNRMAFSWQS